MNIFPTPVDLLGTAFNRILRRGHIEGSALLLLQGVVSLLCDPATLLTHGQKILKGQDASDILMGLIAQPSTVSVELPPVIYAPEAVHGIKSTIKDFGEVDYYQQSHHEVTALVASVLGHKYDVNVVIGDKGAYSANLSQAIALSEDFSAKKLLADRGYNSDGITIRSVTPRMDPVISPRKHRKASALRYRGSQNQTFG